MDMVHNSYKYAQSSKHNFTSDLIPYSCSWLITFVSIGCLYFKCSCIALVAPWYVSSSLQNIQLTLNLVFSLLLFSLCKFFQCTSSITAFLLELALLPLAELSHLAAILLKLQTQGNTCVVTNQRVGTVANSLGTHQRID